MWNPYFYKTFAGYGSIAPFWHIIEQSFLERFPTAEDFNRLASNLPFRFIAQQKDIQYELETFQFNKIPMREQSWHDFFNNLTWLIWPNLKRAIIERIGRELTNNHNNQRTSLQNMMVHFDECGIVICSCRHELFHTIEQFQWKKFFFETTDLTQYCEAIIIGHGLMEKALSPYIGMTGKALFLSVESDFFARSYQEKMAIVDQQMAQIILSDDLPCSPQALAPFPLLGWPGWWPNNNNESFYDNVAYFRRSRFIKPDI